MKERPILFSAPMVRALLDGRKTQTRRVVTGSERWPANAVRVVPLESRGTVLAVAENRCTYGPEIRNPYGQPGDRLWGRETFFAWGRWETRYNAKKGRDEWHFIDMTLECGKAYLYGADQPRPQPLACKRDGGVTPKWWKRPAIFMPRVACRLVLEVRQVRVERLQDISEADAIAEGGVEVARGWWSHTGQTFPGGVEPSAFGGTALDSYALLWDQINGAGAWDENPWVWVVSFARVGTTAQERATHGQTFG